MAVQLTKNKTNSIGLAYKILGEGHTTQVASSSIVPAAKQDWTTVARSSRKDGESQDKGRQGASEHVEAFEQIESELVEN